MNVSRDCQVIRIMRTSAIFQRASGNFASVGNRIKIYDKRENSVGGWRLDSKNSNYAPLVINSGFDNLHHAMKIERVLSRDSRFSRRLYWKLLQYVQFLSRRVPYFFIKLFHHTWWYFDIKGECIIWCACEGINQSRRIKNQENEKTIFH